MRTREKVKGNSKKGRRTLWCPHGCGKTMFDVKPAGVPKLLVCTVCYYKTSEFVGKDAL